MKLVIISILFLGFASSPAQAQESTAVVYDYALMKREYVGKNDIFTVTYRDEPGIARHINGYIRASANTNRIIVYSYNAVNRNYDLVEISLSAILSITLSESQKVVITDKPKIITSGGILKAAAIVLVAAGLALLIFHKEL